MRNVVWFSCGAASAALAKLATERLQNVHVVYCDTLASEHTDNARFLADVERWIGKKVEIIKSEKYANIEDVFAKTRYMAGPSGARCTVEMKKVPRINWQRPDDTHLFGYTVEEQKRADHFDDSSPELFTRWLLIEQGVTKQACLDMVKAAGIELPAMYRLGYEHNNCIGCVKATSPKYWNKVRRDFPKVFADRAHQSRLLGVRLARVKGVRVYLDELPPEADGPSEDIECGPVCRAPVIVEEA